MTNTARNAASKDRPESFQLKGGLFPMTLLDLKTPDLGLLESELAAKVAEAPAFFLNSPVVLGLDTLDEQDQADLDILQLQALCQRLNLVPAAIRSNNPALARQCQTLRLAVLKGKEKTAPEPVPEPAQSTPSVPTSTTKIVATPVRSGQQIYAPGGDLIVLTGVSAGAEVLADGNIHIYGALRGRALAGIQGDTQARIFCTSQEAELISIAGSFMVDETLRTTLWREAVQIYWADGDLAIQPLTV